MESRFGEDFRSVRVHTDAHAARSAEQLGAVAYTIGRDIFFAAGRYQPQTREGQRLLAHELTHVAQQQGSLPLPAHAGPISSPTDASEQAADRIADEVVSSARASKPPRRAGTTAVPRKAA